MKEFNKPSLPLALGLVVSASIAAQSFALPASAQTVESEDVVAPQMGGVETFREFVDEAPEFSAMLPTPSTDAFPMGGGGEGEKMHHHGWLSEGNKLTDDQYERIYAIKEDMEDQMGLKRAQERILHRKLKDTLSAATIDTKAAQDIGSKITGLRADMSSLKIDTMIKIAQVFTPEQRKELRMAMIRHHHGWGHKGGHHWGGHCGGGHGPSHEHHEMMGK